MYSEWHISWNAKQLEKSSNTTKQNINPRKERIVEIIPRHDHCLYIHQYVHSLTANMNITLAQKVGRDQPIGGPRVLKVGGDRSPRSPWWLRLWCQIVHVNRTVSVCAWFERQLTTTRAQQCLHHHLFRLWPLCVYVQVSVSFPCVKRVGWKKTRSSAVAERPRDAPCRWNSAKSLKIFRNYTVD